MLLSIGIRADNLQPEKDIGKPLIEHIKSVFRIDPLPTRGFHKVSAILLLSVLLYQLMVYYNCKMNLIQNQ
jgi:hypothetical protein